MFGDWSDEDWCEFDNYMIGSLQGYLSTSLVKSKFVNLKIRQLSAETSHDFIEWCGLTNNQEGINLLPSGERLYKNDLYYNFIEEYPDYAPKSKLTISRTRFYNWLVSYALYKESVQPEEGRDNQGRWIIIRMKPRAEPQTQIDI
jgi:hypothetical protein